MGNLSMSAIQKLKDLANQYKAKFDSINPEGIERTKKLTRIEAGKILLDAKQRIDAGEGGGRWWTWFKNNIQGPKYSKSNAEKLLRIAAAPDPERAWDVEKQNNAEQMQRTREENKAKKAAETAWATARAAGLETDRGKAFRASAALMSATQDDVLRSPIQPKQPTTDENPHVLEVKQPISDPVYDILPPDDPDDSVLVVHAEEDVDACDDEDAGDASSEDYLLDDCCDGPVMNRWKEILFEEYDLDDRGWRRLKAKYEEA